MTRRLRVRMNSDRTALCQVRTGRPAVVFVDCEPLPTAAAAEVARVWWLMHSVAGGHGIGVDPSGAPTWKFKVSVDGDHHYRLRLAATTPSGSKSVPSKGRPGAAILPGDPGDCGAVARQLVEYAIALYGTSTSRVDDGQT